MYWIYCWTRFVCVVCPLSVGVLVELILPFLPSFCVSTLFASQLNVIDGGTNDATRDETDLSNN